jgi:hypothetical protein
MATSGTTAFNLDLTELVEEAFERAGAEMRSGYDLRTARRSLNLMFTDWANRGINMWTIEQDEITLVPGTGSYNLPTDTVDIIEHIVRIQDAGAGANTMDVPFRFLNCMVAGLAYMISMKVPGGLDRVGLLKQQYDEAWELAATEDRDKSSSRFVPRYMAIG